MSFEVRGLSYAYRPGELVLRDVSLDIPSGTTTAVLGMSGSGKSTLLYLLGLLWDGGLTGDITYRRDGDRIPYHGLAKDRAAALRRTDFGFVLQSSYMLPHFSCAQNAAMPLALQGARRPEKSEILARLVAAIDGDRCLSAVMDNPAGSVSGGQRQRFAVVRAVVHDPHVVFADEPFSSLDEENTDLTLKLLAAWRKGETAGPAGKAKVRTLILVCHDLDMAFKHADHFVFVTRGGKVLENRAFDKKRFRGPVDLRHVIQHDMLPSAAAIHHDGPVAAVGRVSR